ncbi:hypothetical protein FB45DRAFT_1150265 [Roridomyces roridus]|uniref:F-box domain-containing protein n=1 Tax=Roridomyces roridus TaxID=1738132 RepID=A0AAD7FKQ5_9AGAR|nr:hypothetical protein FB45DRAFT_1150265 [Roridomyces roridus]
MHRCLQVPELSWTSPSSVRRPDHRDLAVLARTCRIFSSHALRLLWHSVPLINLLRLLPRDTFHFTMTETKYIMTPRRPILQDSDFERLRSFAVYVRSLFCHPDQADTSAMFESLRLWLSGSMFPTLHAVYWSHQEDDFPFIERFLVPSLTSIHMPCNFPAASALISSLATRCPLLTHIYSSNHAVSAAVSALSECVRALDHIQSLSTDALDRPALDHLSGLPSLRELSLKCFPADFPSPGSQPFFPSLVEFQVSNLDSAARFLERGSDIPLARLWALGAELEPTNYSTPDEMHCLLSAIESTVSHSSLADLMLAVGYSPFDRSEASTYTIRASSLRLLLCFNNLTDIAIHTAVGFDLDDTTILEMARSWPHLEVFRLDTYFGTSQPRTTLSCLEAFAKYCPHLSMLSMAFDATVVPESHGDFFLKHLTTLEVDVSPISTAESVAQFIARVCPRLTLVVTLVHGQDEYWEANVVPEAFGYDTIWTEVGSILQGSREEEHHAAAAAAA